MTDACGSLCLTDACGSLCFSAIFSAGLLLNLVHSGATPPFVLQTRGLNCIAFFSLMHKFKLQRNYAGGETWRQKHLQRNMVTKAFTEKHGDKSIYRNNKREEIQTITLHLLQMGSSAYLKFEVVTQCCELRIKHRVCL